MQTTYLLKNAQLLVDMKRATCIMCEDHATDECTRVTKRQAVLDVLDAEYKIDYMVEGHKVTYRLAAWLYKDKPQY